MQHALITLSLAAIAAIGITTLLTATVPIRQPATAPTRCADCGQDENYCHCW